MRVLLASPLYPPEIGGPATYARFLEKELPPLGIAVTVVPFSTVRHLPPGVRHLAYLFRLVKEGRHADILFAQDAYSVGLPAVFAAKLLRLPLLIRVPGEYAWEQGVARFGITDDVEVFQTKRYAWEVEVMRRMQSWTARQACALVVPSAFFARIIVGWGVVPERVHVIENALEPVEPENVSDVPPAPFILSAGRLVGGKGFDGLIRLLPKLPEWQLVIVGDGPLRRVLEHDAARLGVDQRVRFIGRVSSGLMRGWYAAATVFVLNSRFETFSYQVAEALAAGTAVIATRVGGIPGLVEDGVNGVLVAPDDEEALVRAIESVVAEPDAWSDRTAAGKASMERLVPGQVIPRLSALITGLS